MEALRFEGYNIKAEHKKISLKCRSDSSGAAWGSSSLLLTRYTERSCRIKTPGDRMSVSALRSVSPVVSVKT